MAVLLYPKSGLARSRTKARRNWRRFPYIIPVLAVATVVILYAAFAAPSSQARVVENFTVRISIQVSQQLHNGTNVLHFITPPQHGIGVPGGTWQAGAYNSYGVNGNYPIYIPSSTSTTYIGYSLIYVKSTSNRTYTLGDFFAVWGEKLGRNNTLGLTSPPRSGSTDFGPSWIWDMCVGASQSTLHEGLWGNETLTPGKNILLSYSDSYCAMA